MEFKVYRYVPNPYLNIINMPIKNTDCKHIALCEEKSVARHFELLASLVSYEYCYMSKGNNFSLNENHIYVQQMAHYPNFRPAKYVITRDGRIWADNTHTSLSILVRQGLNSRICEADYYIVDLRPTTYKIILPSAKYRFDEQAYNKIISNAFKIQNRLDKGWRPHKFTYTLESLYLHDNYFTLTNNFVQR